MNAVRRALGRLTGHLRVVLVLLRVGMIAPLRPDKYVGMVAVIVRRGVTATTGISLAAVRRPRGTALVDERGTMTWRELDDSADALAVGLLELAGGPRTVAVLARNHRGFVQALAAASRTGGDVLLLNTSFSAPQLHDVLVREEVQVVVHDDEFAAVVATAGDGVPGLVPVRAWTDAPAGAVTGTSVDDLVARHRGTRPPRVAKPGSVVLLTSGTTGTPKGARRGADGGAGALAAMFERIPWRAEETVVVAAPMFHAWGFGQLAVAATMTCTVVMRRRFDPEATLALVEEHGATGLGVVPVMLERIMDLPGEVLDRYPCRDLRFVTASGSRMRGEAVTAFMDRYGDVVCNSYNATEAGLISCATPADLRTAPDTAGRAVAGATLRIVDEGGSDVPTGEVGRIAVSSGSHFAGYTTGGGKELLGDFMVTGDLGRLDDAGRLFVVGRDDEMIVSGGENVYPLEVEQALDAHPDVHECAVVGVDDDQFGQRLAAYVVRRPGAEVSADALRDHVKGRLAGYKAPRDVTFLAELPRNATGKVLKRALG